MKIKYPVDKFITPKTFLISITFLLSLSATSQNEESLKKYNLLGDVKSVEIVSKNATEDKIFNWIKQYFNERGMLIKEEKHFSDNERRSTRLISYNERGNEILDTKNRSHGKVEYVWNDKQMLVKKIYPRGTAVYEYNSNGKLDKRVVRNNQKNYIESVQKYTYNPNGFKIDEKLFLEDSRVSHHSVTKFNNRGLITESIVGDYKKLNYYENSLLVKEENYRKNELRETKIFTYQKNGLLTSETQIANGKTERFSIEYDNYGNITKEVERDRITTYAYEYDARNNWIKKTRYRNGKPSSVQSRTIQYYTEIEGVSKPVPFAFLDTKPKINNCEEENCFGPELAKLLKELIPKSRYIEFGIVGSKRINLNVVVEEDGSFSKILVYRASKDLKDFLTNQLSSMRASSPGKKDGKIARTVFSIPLLINE